MATECGQQSSSHSREGWLQVRKKKFGATQHGQRDDNGSAKNVVNNLKLYV